MRLTAATNRHNRLRDSKRVCVRDNNATALQWALSCIQATLCSRWQHKYNGAVNARWWINDGSTALSANDFRRACMAMAGADASSTL